MTTQQTPDPMNLSLRPIALRTWGGAMLTASLFLLSACAGGAEDVEVPEDQVSLAIEHCDLALDDFPDNELAYLSCSLNQPVDCNGFTASDLADDSASKGEPETASKACNTYYGACTGVFGCSVAEGEGWQYVECGSYLYAWLTICNGDPSDWGSGFCLW